MSRNSPNPSIELGGIRGRVAWALYDWANSPFTTLIITFIFPAYFSSAVIKDDVAGQVMWGYAMALSGISVALLAPVMGAIADAGGRQKPYLLGFTLLCCAGSMGLWLVKPDPAFAALALVCVVAANIGFEFGIVFNNAMLPHIVGDARLGRLSGWAWGLGYFGGLAALVIVLFGFVRNPEPWFGISTADAGHVRIAGPIVATCLILFGWPVFAFTPDRDPTGRPIGEAAREGLQRLRQTVAALPNNRNIFRFLIAHMLYADGLATIFAFGGIYAAGTFRFSLAEVIQFGILLNITAGIGAFLCGWLDDLIGSRRTIVLALSGILAGAGAAVLTEDRMTFWIAGAMLGFFVGPAQSASRSLMTRLTPEHRHSEYFGLFSLSGKATAFAGPALVAGITDALASQRMGIASTLLFFVLGLGLLLTIREPPRRSKTAITV